MWLSEGDQARLLTDPEFQFPIPTRVISNGEYTPPPQTDVQRELEARLSADADAYSRLAGLDRRRFLRSSLGLSAAFLSLNSVFGNLFNVAKAEAIDPAAARERSDRLANQFVFDGHLHFVHDDYPDPRVTGLRFAARQMGAGGLPDRRPTLDDLKFENFAKEVYLDSDTAVGIVSSATSDKPELMFLTNRQIAESVRRFNELAGSERLFGHAVFRPGQPGWLEEIEEAISEHKPISWKGYTIGDPLGPSRFAWRMDDEELVYPAYEKMQKAGINTICVHKGLLPQRYEEQLPTWQHANVDDVGKAARDWPGLNFVIYHAALRPAVMFDPAFIEVFERTGRMDWVTDLAEIPQKWGVSNVWADVGTSFGSAAISHPRLAAGMMATLVKGLGPDRVLWGTDAVWYGSPQWQIEAFRRIETPEDLRRKFGWPELGAADGPLKNAILGGNSAMLYKMTGTKTEPASVRRDRLAHYKRLYQSSGEDRSNAFYGFIHSSQRR
ncbi:amidohydrolase family protein [Erythrobacter sp.]|uniref:amidohydrolase family protein n=1 Tax=Erythrobacter sp. TaxID=1042 RepID=UPI0025CE67CB|nr:amidohydrolase family protein [Erythrobacter sp.]